MPQPYQADETSTLANPPCHPVEWVAKPNGRYYEWERNVDPKFFHDREEGVVVKHQSAYSALQEASRLLQLAPEHIHLERKEEDVPEPDVEEGADSAPPSSSH